MNGVDVVLVIVYKDNDTYSKLHWDKPMSKPETTATTATRDKYWFQVSVTRFSPVYLLYK